MLVMINMATATFTKGRFPNQITFGCYLSLLQRFSDLKTPLKN